MGHQMIYNLSKNVSTGRDEGTFWESLYILLNFDTSPEEPTRRILEVQRKHSSSCKQRCAWVVLKWHRAVFTDLILWGSTHFVLLILWNFSLYWLRLMIIWAFSLKVILTGSSAVIAPLCTCDTQSKLPRELPEIPDIFIRWILHLFWFDLVYINLCKLYHLITFWFILKHDLAYNSGRKEGR